ncbi:hypothetical protein QFC21_004243 [Naganishia friedmannii]|uniref:Uncharacterized protein n=1 Tax=Naganishia friedmannii TaxID=89922 RepID=A0ACC2VJ76_9TREE|nr:hypothetical protein QFC21_004243 [Naganishia friedmannii]
MAADREQSPFHRFDVDDSQTPTTVDYYDIHSSDVVFSLPPVDGGKDAWPFPRGSDDNRNPRMGPAVQCWCFERILESRALPDRGVSWRYHVDIGSDLTGLLYMLGVVFGPLGSAYPQYRWQLMSVGLVGASLSMILSAFATQPWHLVITFGLLYPLAGPAILLFEWFQQRRGMASGIMYAGTGAGGTVFPFIVQALLHTFGYKAAMISLGLGFFCVGAIAIIPIKPRVPTGRARSGEEPLSTSGRSHSVPKIDWSFLRRNTFYAFGGSILLSSLGNFLPTVWIPSLLLLGYLTDHWPLRMVISLSCLGSAAACLLLWGFSTNTGVLIAFVVIFGLLGPSFSAVWAKLIGIIAKDDPNLPSTIFSLFAFMRGIGNITSGTILTASCPTHLLNGRLCILTISPVSEALLKSPAWKSAAGAYGFKNYVSTSTSPAAVVAVQN